MANKRYEAEALQAGIRKRYVDELTALFCNSVIVDGIEGDAPQSFLLLTLLRFGQVGKYNGEWYRLVAEAPLNQYGLPSYYSLQTGNGIILAVHIPREKINIYRANAISYPYIGNFEAVADSLALMDTSIRTNLLNSQTAWLMGVDNEEQAENIKRAYEDMALGLPAIVVNKKTMGESFADEKNVSVMFIADKIADLRERRWDDALKRCGIVTANDYKRERVQTAEVNAGAGESIDYIYQMIDQFNQDAEKQGQPERMRFNGVAQEYDQTDEENNEAGADQADDSEVMNDEQHN